ncbi:MAG: beta-propeller domain-containing protein [Desulfurococcales archaeon]|nr:beta-propeller domain-containing protein [Desulfurococcales archaeon]
MVPSRLALVLAILIIVGISLSVALNHKSPETQSPTVTNGWDRIDHLILSEASKNGQRSGYYYPSMPGTIVFLDRKAVQPAATGNYQVAGVAELDFSSFINGRVYVIEGSKLVLYTVSTSGEVSKKEVNITSLSRRLAPAARIQVRIGGSTGSAIIPPSIYPAGVIAGEKSAILLVHVSYSGVPPVGGANGSVFYPDKVLVVVMDPGLRVVGHMMIDGYLIDARLNGDNLVLTTGLPSILRMPEPLVVHPSINLTSIDPGDVVVSGRPLGYVLVVSLNTTSMDYSAKAILSDTESLRLLLTKKGLLYLAMNSPGPRPSTRILALEASPSRVRLAGNTTLPGVIYSQWQLEPYGDYLVAVTGSGGRGRVSLYVLNATSLSVVSRLENISLPGEEVYAVRIVGDKLLFVTFLHKDPLYAVSLRDPRNPVILGFLKAPGVDQYLHPLDGGLILGVGREGSSLRVSLYKLTEKGLIVLDRYYMKYAYSPVLGPRGP